MEINNPRQLAREAIKASPAALWSENERFVANLRQRFNAASHCSSSNSSTETKCFNREQLQRIHLEYRSCYCAEFTDALLIAQYQSYQLRLV